MSVATGIGLVVFATILGGLGALMFKLGSGNFRFNPLELIKNWRLMLGFALYGGSTIPFIYALRFGELSVLYPFASMQYIWITILSVIVLKEKLNWKRVLGLVFIIGGVALIGLGSA